MQAWSSKQAAPTTSIELRANVCCVKYNPNSAHEIAVGSADHNVHLYDLRKANAATHVFSGVHLQLPIIILMHACAHLSAINPSSLFPFSLLPKSLWRAPVLRGEGRLGVEGHCGCRT